MQKTKIEWTDYSINPIKGLCKNKCFYCYAYKIYKRFKLDEHIRFDKNVFFKILKIKKPSKIFVCSTHDLFGSWISEDWIREVIAIMACTNQHIFQLLTKEPKRMQNFSFTRNVWLGTTIEDNRFKYRAVTLGSIRHKPLFTSFEPLLTPMDKVPINKMHWLIIGAMTGPGSKKYRPKIKWVKDILKRADIYKIPVFLKDNLIPVMGQKFVKQRQILSEIMIKIKNRLTAIDLFAGCGGFSLGMKKAGFDVLVAVEIDKGAAETYRYNLGRVTKHNPKATVVMEEDIKQITSQRLLKTAKVKKGELDILFGSPPCQGFSTVNSKNRGLDNPKSQLMHEFIRMTKGVQAKIFYLENVPGMLAYKDFFILVMQKFEKCGYVVRCLMMDASSYGVPQTRKRIFIQGVRKELKYLPTFPPPTHFDPECLKTKGKMFQPAAIAVEAFAINGFDKGEVKDLYWNKVLGIQMNRKTAPYVFDVAMGKLIGEAIKN